MTPANSPPNLPGHVIVHILQMNQQMLRATGVWSKIHSKIRKLNLAYFHANPFFFTQYWDSSG